MGRRAKPRLQPGLDTWTATPLCRTDENQLRAGVRSRRRIGKLAKAGRRRLARTWRRLRSKHPPLGLLFLLALVGGGIFLATLPTRHEPKIPGTGTPRNIIAKAAPSPAAAPPAARSTLSSGKAVVAPSPIQQASLRPPPPLPAPPRAEPAWLRFAVPAPPSGNRPLVAIVLDDLGLDRARTAAAIRLPGPVTLSFMTYASDLAEQTEAARRAGHELLLHVPMEAVDQHENPGPHALVHRAVARRDPRSAALGARPIRRLCRHQ